MLKYPQAGRVKTRLGESIGMERAAKVYRELAGHAVAVCRSAGFPVMFHAAPPYDVSRMKKWLGEDAVPQMGADLGERMVNALTCGFTEGYERGVLIGTDVPGITAELLGIAAELAEPGHAVLGPAEDGGFYLIALHRDDMRERLLSEMTWSTAQVFADTKARLAGLHVHELPKLFDVDTAEDLKRIPDDGVDRGLKERIEAILAEGGSK